MTSSFHRRPRRFLITGTLALAATLASYIAVQSYLGQSSGAAVLPVPPPAVPVRATRFHHRGDAVQSFEIGRPAVKPELTAQPAHDALPERMWPVAIGSRAGPRQVTVASP